MARLRKIMALYGRNKGEVQGITHSQRSATIVDALTSRYIYRAVDLANNAGRSAHSTCSIIAEASPG